MTFPKIPDISRIRRWVVSRRGATLLLVITLLVSAWMVRPAGAAVVFRDSSVGDNGAGSTTLSLTMPTTTAADDFMVAVVTVRGGNGVTITPPSNWTQRTISDSGTTVIKSATFTASRSLAGAGPYVFTFSASQKAVGIVVSYSGVDLTNPIDASGSQPNPSSATMTAPSITTTSPNAMLVGLFGTSTGTTVTVGSSMTLRGQTTSSGGGQAGTKATTGAQDVIQAAAGATGTKTMTAGVAAVNVGHLLALKPAPTFSVSSYRVFNNSDTSTSFDFTKLANPSTLPTGASGMGTAWSQDGTYMSVTHTSSPYITIYKRSGDTFTKLGDPATLPAGAGNGVAWSPDGTYMTVAHATTPFVTIYKRSGDTFTKLANPATLPPSTGNGVAWSPDGTYMTVAHASTPFVTIYKQSVDTFTKLANPASLPAGAAQGVAWSPDGTYMTVAHSTYPNFAIFKRSGDTFTKITSPALGSTGYGSAWSPDGNYMAIAGAGTPYFMTFSRSGDTFTQLANPTSPPPSGANGISWTTDGAYISVTHALTPYISIYKVRPEAQVSTALAAQDTAATTGGAGQPFRLRMGVHVTEGSASRGAELKLQYAPRSGTCDTGYTGESFVDVSASSGSLRYYNNTVLNDADGVAANANDPAHSTDTFVKQSYEEANNFSVAHPIAVGQDGLWDFSLVFDSSAAIGSYCLRVVNTDGTAIAAPSQVPEVVNPAPTVGQANYRFFANADSVTPGASLAAQDTAATVATETPFRLRQRLAVDGGQISTNYANYKLQYAEKSGVCDVGFSGETYIDLNASSGPQTLYPNTAVNDSSYGTTAWPTPSNVASAPDAVYSSITSPFSSGTTHSQYLKLTNFGFSIPSQATVTRVVVDIDAIADANDFSLSGRESAKLVKNGVPTGNDKGSESWWSSQQPAPIDDTVAGWGVTLTPADVNSSGFGFAFAAFASYDDFGSLITGVDVDAVSVTVYYTLPGGSMAYASNATAADLAAISSSGSDPTNASRPTVYQSYRETDPFTNNVAAIPNGSDGLWDFALTSGSSAAGKTYCLRVVKSDSSLLDSYSQIPEITFSSGGGGPTLDQQLRGGAGVVNGTKSPLVW